MLISIAIPAFNEVKYLPDTIAAAKQASRVFGAAGWKSEIVVCDNNSADDTAGVAKANGARVVFEPFNQISASRNAAGRAAKGDWRREDKAAELLDVLVHLVRALRCWFGDCVVTSASLRSYEFDKVLSLIHI